MPDFKFDKQLKQLFFNATEKYAKSYGDRHGQIQVLGMSKPMPLDAIYSGVRMLDTESMKSYASQADLEKAYRNRGDRRFRHHDCPKRNGIDIANEYERLIVLGDPGIGKSTFLRKVGLEALKGEQGSYKHEQIPVFLELKRLTSPNLDLGDCIAAEFENCGFPSSKGFTQKALNNGKLLILFDGLDEVPTSNLDIVIQKIQDLVDRYSDNRFIASCRIAAYHTYFKRVNTVAISEFDDAQIEKFITNWFSSELDQQSHTAQQCWELLQKPENKGAKELAQSPLLLTFLCMVYNESLTVPSNRTTLYGQALDILLQKWAAEKRIKRDEIYAGFHSDLEKELLAKIAKDGFEDDQLFYSKALLVKEITEFLGDALDAPKNLNASAVLEAIEVQQGILVERATDIYSFSHLTLQEFLTAKYIVKWHLLDDLVELHATDDRWREVIILVAGLMGRAAIGLLEKLEVQIQKLSNNLKLRGWLAWSEAKTTHSTSDYSGEIKRVFSLQLILDLASTFDFDGFDFNLTSDCQLDLAGDFDFDLANDLANHRNLAVAYHHGDRPLGRRGLNIIASPFARTLASARFTLGKQIITDVDLQPLISYLENSLHATTISTEELTSTISSSLKIPLEFLELSRKDVLVIINYFSTCQLMINCSKQASGLSAQQWEAIKQRMFLPKPAE
ncbi:NACHT domain-containing protein [Acaryochloris marina NIES-2412]|uniref:NACHT domain-containing protein n=1 Tax=Acaryochloris marina TaxID=155978 RepID=UPI00405944AA